MIRTAGLTILAILLTIAAAIVNWWPSSASSPMPPNPILMAELQEPKLGQGRVVLSDPGEPIEFVYQLQNCGRKTLKKLNAKLFCQCPLTREFPSSIAPGEKVEFLLPF